MASSSWLRLDWEEASARDLDAVAEQLCGVEWLVLNTRRLTPDNIAPLVRLIEGAGITALSLDWDRGDGAVKLLEALQDTLTGLELSRTHPDILPIIPSLSALRGLKLENIEDPSGLRGSALPPELRWLILSCTEDDALIADMLAGGRGRKLQHLDLANRSLSTATLTALMSADLPHLHTLKAGLTWQTGSPSGALEGLRRPGAFPALRALHLRSSRLGDREARALVAWEGIGRLTTLNLAENRIEDDGAIVLSRAFKQGTLDLKNNRIGAAGIRSLLTRLPPEVELVCRELGVGDVGLEILCERGGLHRMIKDATLSLYRADITDRGLTALAGSPALAAVERLELGSSDTITDEGLLALIASPHTTGLRFLRGSSRHITDRSAEALASPQALPALSALYLSAGITHWAMPALRARGIEDLRIRGHSWHRIVGHDAARTLTLDRPSEADIADVEELPGTHSIGGLVLTCADKPLPTLARLLKSAHLTRLERLALHVRLSSPLSGLVLCTTLRKARSLALTELTLTGVSLGRGDVTMLAKMRWFADLTTLHLGGPVDPAAAKVLARKGGRLEMLTLEGTGLSQAAVVNLMRSLPRLLILSIKEDGLDAQALTEAAEASGVELVL